MQVPDGKKAQTSTDVDSLASQRSGSLHRFAPQPEDELVELKVPASLEYRELVTRATAQMCKRLRERSQSSDTEFMHEAVSAIGEAFNNVVLHSYANIAGGHVTLLFRVGCAELEIEVLDDGVGFNPSDDPDLDFPGLHESGMGLFIMRSFMDEVEHHSGTPNRLRLKKQLPLQSA